MNCAYHQERTAHAYCACCAKPICPACERRRGMSFLGGFETPQCRNCLETIARIEKEFLARLDRDHSCAKHPNERARLRFKSCRLFHCDYCLYFVTKGIFRASASRSKVQIAGAGYQCPRFRIGMLAPKFLEAVRSKSDLARCFWADLIHAPPPIRVQPSWRPHRLTDTGSSVN